jgi:hypothetical protein
LNFDPSDVFKDQLAGMYLTVFDSEVEDEVFQNLQGPEELHFSQSVNIYFKQFIDELMSWKQNLIVTELSNKRQTQSIGQIFVHDVV